MKKLTCEMCGSTDIIKQDGVFVCQVCGCKYSVEEAKKMMIEGTVEVTGTVKVDNTDAINNYLDMARNAVNTGNNAEAEGYCNRIIEMDMNNWEAWYIKGKAAGWQSTLANVRIPETINAFGHAMKNCPEEQKDNLADVCKDDIKSLQIAVLSLRVKNFNTHPNKTDLRNFEQTLDMIRATSASFTAQTLIPMGPNEAGLCMLCVLNGITEAYRTVWRDYQGSENHPNSYEWDRFIGEGNTLVSALEDSLTLGDKFNDDIALNNVKINIYNKMIEMQTAVRNSCCYEVQFSNGRKSYITTGTINAQGRFDLDDMIRQWKQEIVNLQDLNRKAQEAAAREAAEEQRLAAEAAQKEADEYWAAHPNEKAALDTEKAALQEQKNQLSARIAALKKESETPVAASRELIDLRYKSSALRQEYSHLGLFSGKRRKEIDVQFKEISHQIELLESEAEKQKTARDANIKEQLSPLEKELAEVNRKLFDITAKLSDPTSNLQSQLEPAPQPSQSSSFAASPVPAASASVSEPKYDVVLTHAGTTKMQLTKAVKDYFNMSLADAKNVVDRAPCTVKTGVSRAEAEDIKAHLEAAGAEVELR